MKKETKNIFCKGTPTPPKERKYISQVDVDNRTSQLEKPKNPTVNYVPKEDGTPVTISGENIFKPSEKTENVQSRLQLIDYEKAKNKIISDVITSEEFRKKVENKCKRSKHNITDPVLIDDLIQQVAMIALSKDSELIYQMYVSPKKSGDNRMMGYLLGILRYQLMSHPDGNPRHNMLCGIKHNSNIFSNSDGEIYDCHLSEDIDPDDHQDHPIYLLMSFLDDDEKDLLINIMQYNGAKQKNALIKHSTLIEKIRQIADDNDIDLMF
ncbi:hypothetical protein [Sphingobacterium chungjuense]|uniref:hypothetical protein n=1 Tax=Sphingobacterium chungjuense TaxID=2675553 RepID=UPI00140BF50F|nr:hypothetical protein [Sphingobacterium chungjuense]